MPLFAAEPKPFTAEYKLYFGDWHLGKGSYSLQKTGKNQYSFNFESTLKILFFSDYREVSSLFFLRNNRIEPIIYRHDRKGTGADYIDIIKFDKSLKKISSSVRGNVTTIPYDSQLMDGLSVQLQLMFDVQHKANNFLYDVLESNVIEHVEFKKLGSGKLDIDGRIYDCIQFEAVRREGHLITHIWFAKELNYLPVKMAHFINGSKRFNGKLIRYSEN